MNNQIEALFTTALGLQPPWHVAKDELNTGKRRMDFEVEHTGRRAACSACGAEHQLIHDRVRRSWRHLDFLQFEAWLHAEIPRVQCDGCGKTTQLPVPWAQVYPAVRGAEPVAVPGDAGAPGVVRGMLDGRSNAYVEAMNGLLQQTKTAARGFRNIENFIAMAYLRMSKLKHLPQNPWVPAIPRDYWRYRHVC